MPTVRLNKRVVDGLRPAEKTIIYYDAELKGFGVRITPAGARSWIVEYRPGGGRSSPTKRMTIGPLGTLTPDEARRKARDVLANARLGGDPAAEQSRQRGALTLAQAAQRFLSDEGGASSLVRYATTNSTSAGTSSHSLAPLTARFERVGGLA